MVTRAPERSKRAPEAECMHRKAEKNRRLPSVDAVLHHEACKKAVEEFGHTATVAQIRKVLDTVRAQQQHQNLVHIDLDEIAARVKGGLTERAKASLQRVFNLTGTVLHTNLGRALLPESAIEAISKSMRHPANLEYDIDAGKRGERDDHVRALITELTGAEDAIVVNNNAAAVVLVLNALALNKDVLVSRGELIEIGGSFRMPDIMAQAGARLIEVGTTNRTHLRDYQSAITHDTALVMKVHTSNYMIKGFTKEVRARELSILAKERDIPLVDDLGSGTLVNLEAFGLARERTVRDAIEDGADLVTFSGDKLLGGPQAGFIVGRRDLVQLCAKNPFKRAMRLDKMRLAALEATLKLYRDPNRLTETLPTLQMLARPVDDLIATGQKIKPTLQDAVGGNYDVELCEPQSQIGSGALPLEAIASCGLAIKPKRKKVSGRALDQLAAAFRILPIPVVGRITDNAFVLDLRTLDDEGEFIAQLRHFCVPENDGAARC